jgi:protein HEXIM1/2
MSKENCSEIEKIEEIRSEENDCDPSFNLLMATEEPTFSVSKNENIDLVRRVAAASTAPSNREEGNLKCDVVVGNVTTTTTIGGKGHQAKEKVDRNNSMDSSSSATHNNKNSRKKTRRGKSKRKSSKPYTKSQWSYHIPRIQNMKRKVILSDVGQPLVPYNTNKFLMEDHVPPYVSHHSGPLAIPPKGVREAVRTRDSSFSIDSEENYFYSLPEDEEEFLTKEFSNVYEDARSERLEAMTKAQLIQEFLQMEATVEQLTRRINARRLEEKGSDDRKLLEQRIKDLTSENSGKFRRKSSKISANPLISELKHKLERNQKSRKDTSEVMSTSSSEDSESDSDSSSNSSLDSRSNSSGSIDLANEIDMADVQPLLLDTVTGSTDTRGSTVPAIPLQ